MSDTPKLDAAIQRGPASAIACGCELERENADLRAQLEAARKDAERYRWLRDESGYYNRPPKDLWVGDGMYHTRVLSGEELDARIDAAIAQGKA